MDCTITMTGNVGTSINHRFGEGANGAWSRSEFRLGCTRRVRGGDGVWSDAGTTWITVVCWGRLADSVRVSLHRGQPVIVVGRLTTDEWSDQNGEVRSRLILTADRIGHDLSRGVAGFNRGSAVLEPPAAPGAEGEPAGARSPACAPSAMADPWDAATVHETDDPGDWSPDFADGVELDDTVEPSAAGEDDAADVSRGDREAALL